MAVDVAGPGSPLARFQAIYAALAEDTHWWEQADWLRFAAQAVVTTPGEPRVVAECIRAHAAIFQADTAWTDALHAPLRFVVAAMLVQAGDQPGACEQELGRVRGLLQRAGFAHGGMYVIMAIVLMRLARECEPIPDVDITRLQALYRHMKRCHWWLTGPHDLPTCALLINLPGTPEDIGRVVEEHYLLLQADGFAAGGHLEQAAHILPLLRLPAKTAVHRYGALAHRFATHGSPPWRRDYEAIAILCFLEDDAETIVTRSLAIHRVLEGLHPRLHHEVLMDLTADLVFLERIGQDRRWVRAEDDPRHIALERTIRDQQAAAAVIACFGATAIDPTTY